MPEEFRSYVKLDYLEFPRFNSEVSKSRNDILDILKELEDVKIN